MNGFANEFLNMTLEAHDNRVLVKHMCLVLRSMVSAHVLLFLKIVLDCVIRYVLKIYFMYQTVFIITREFSVVSYQLALKTSVNVTFSITHMF